MKGKIGGDLRYHSKSSNRTEEKHNYTFNQGTGSKTKTATNNLAYKARISKEREYIIHSLYNDELLLL